VAAVLGTGGHGRQGRAQRAIRRNGAADLSPGGGQRCPTDTALRTGAPPAPERLDRVIIGFAGDAGDGMCSEVVPVVVEVEVAVPA
jgi:hypothetical protein